MRAGTFNMNDFLNKLYEEDQMGPKDAKEGIIIPDTNQKSYDWLKKEYHKGQVEVKVEMKLGNQKFEPGYSIQTKLDSVKDFKPGNYGSVKPGTTEKSPKPAEQKPASKPVSTPPQNKENKQGFTKLNKNTEKPKTSTPETNKTEKKTEDKPKSNSIKVNLKTKKSDGQE